MQDYSQVWCNGSTRDFQSLSFSSNLNICFSEKNMSKFGFDKKTSIDEKIMKGTLAHKHVPGRAYEVSNPTEKLIHMIGGGFFNEPRYYGDNSKDDEGLSEQAKEVIQAIQDVANSDSPEDLLLIASWARDPEKGLKLRTTPQVMLAIAAANKNTQPFVRKYSSSIMRRVDEVRQVFAAFRHLNQNFEKKEDLSKKSANKDRSKIFRGHRGSLPHSLRKGIAEVLSKTSIYELLKYNSDESPTLRDVLLMVGGSSKLPSRKNEKGEIQKDGWPVSKGVFEYIVNNKVTEDAPEMIKSRDVFFKLENLSEVTPYLVKQAGLTWENITSKFGTSKEVWDLCIPLMGEMALTRNLRNFEDAKISKASWDLVYNKLGKVENTVQLPFRFFTALKNTKSTEAHTLVARQLDQSCQNIPELLGTTVVLVDNSGSAVGATVSKNSEMRVSDAGNTLAAIVAKRMGRNAMIGAFGDSCIWIPINQMDSCVTIKETIDRIAQTEERSKHNALAIPAYKKGAGVGQSTETGLWWALDDLTKRGIVVNRIILLSDLCCYTQGDNNCGVNMTTYFGKDATIQGMVERYRRIVNPNTSVYSINLAGYSQAQVKGKNTHLLSGWSEQIFSMIRDLEIETPQQTPVEVPAMAVLKERYTK